LHALLTGERQGYYADFGTLPGLAKTFTSGFFHDGTYSQFRGRRHGAPVDRATVPGYRFVVFLQDHDQVGNRARGDRLSQLISAGLARVGALLLLTGPYTPMLWMGEEWGAQTPWQFFTSHPEKDLGELTTQGRKQEFASHGWDEDDVPDPQDPATFERSHLDWSEPKRPEHAQMLTLYRTLISLRHHLPELTDPRLDRVAVDYDEQANWLSVHRGDLRVVANLSGTARTVPLDRPSVDVLLSTERGFRIGPDGIHLPGESGAIVRVI
jgi:maltooligosyltrehalose trehalohydrolase